jgi:hypothetical protein
MFQSTEIMLPIVSRASYTYLQLIKWTPFQSAEKNLESFRKNQRLTLCNLVINLLLFCYKEQITHHYAL